jgi:hypothetical protein
LGEPEVIKKMGYDWQLRQIMADRGVFQTSDLAAPLAERGHHPVSRATVAAGQPATATVVDGRPGRDMRHPSLRAQRPDQGPRRERLGPQDRHRPDRGRPGTTTHHGPATTPDRVTTPAQRRSAAAQQRLRDRLLRDVPSIAPEMVDALLAEAHADGPVARR